MFKRFVEKVGFVLHFLVDKHKILYIYIYIPASNGYGMVWIYPFTHDANVANAGFGWDSPQGLLGNWSQC